MPPVFYYPFFMKKILSTIVFCVLVSHVSIAQNLQLHYDFRNTLYGSSLSKTNYITATFEMFKPDRFGSTFMFVDFDFSGSKTNLGTIYAEIARDIKIDSFPVMPHIEYNGGIGSGFVIDNAFLAGGSYNFDIGHFAFNTYLAYKLHTFERLSHDIQWTLSWGADLLSDRLTVSGFVDVWTENLDRSSAIPDKKVIVLSEPQVWYNIFHNFSVGSEVKLSYNFLADRKFYVIPTLAVKYTF